MKALRNHFAGEDNATRNIAEVELLHDYMHYKNEILMSFELFLTKCQNVYIIFKEGGEPMEEDDKIHFLFKQVKQSYLQKYTE